MQRQWTPIKEYSDILFEYFEGIAKITINRRQEAPSGALGLRVRERPCGPLQ